MHEDKKGSDYTNRARQRKFSNGKEISEIKKRKRWKQWRNSNISRNYKFRTMKMTRNTSLAK